MTDIGRGEGLSFFSQAYGTCCDSVYYSLQLTKDFNNYMDKPLFLYQIINAA
jgi:hypothetical protein